MIRRQQDVDRFIEVLKQEREARQRRLLEYPEEEQTRLRWIEFRQAIETAWLPIMEEYLNVLGKPWFGYEMRLKGPEFRKELIACPAYVVAHEIFGPMAVFWVAENSWKEREVPFTDMEGKTEYKTELFKEGWRCQIVMKNDGQYHFQSDGHNTLAQFDNGMQVDREQLVDIFAEAYLIGPHVIFYKWKNIAVGDERDSSANTVEELTK